MKKDKDWKTQYKTIILELEDKEKEWAGVESILRKTIARLSIAGRGIDARLDDHLKIIQNLSRDKQDQKLGDALEKLSSIVASLDDEPVKPAAITETTATSTDSSSLLLELLQSIRFKDDQRADLKLICSDLLKSLAQSKESADIKTHLSRLSTLINDNFEVAEKQQVADSILLQLIDLLDLDDTSQAQIRSEISGKQSFTQSELSKLASLINAQFQKGTGNKDDNASINEVLTTLLERLTVVQGAGESAALLQSRVLDGIEDSQWPDTLNEIVTSISDALKKLNEEKHELEDFIVNVTEQLGQITEVIAADHEDHLSDHQDRESLNNLMQDSVKTIKKNVEGANDILQLKTVVVHNIDLIRSGVEEFMTSANARHQAIEQRNNALLDKMSKMEAETNELQNKLTENRKKLLFDSLTGVGSRLSYDEQLEQELARWQRYGTSFSYVILDIDHFKKINDKFGHSAGDKALKITAKMMLSQIRKSDSIFRIGGEEFVLLLPNTSVDKAEPLVNKLRETIANSSIHCKQERVLLTLSAGITEPKTNDSVKSLYERADSGLYRAKNSGRNCQFVA